MSMKDIPNIISILNLNRKLSKIEKKKEQNSIRLEKDKLRIDRINSERIEYYKIKPICLGNILGMRVIGAYRKDGSLHYNSDGTRDSYRNGTLIQFFMKDGRKKYLKGSNCQLPLSRSEVYESTVPIDDIADVLCHIIPRFKNVNYRFNLSTADERFVDTILSSKIETNEYYRQSFTNEDEIEKLLIEEQAILQNLIADWKNVGVLNLYGNEFYNAWSDKINSIDQAFVELKNKQNEERQKKTEQIRLEREKSIQAERQRREEEERIQKEQNEKEQQAAIIKAGEQGEHDVRYALSWLDDTFITVNNKAVKIKNSEYRDEEQEFDHIVVGPTGIYLIETKAYSGSIKINSNGNWERNKGKGVNVNINFLKKGNINFPSSLNHSSVA